MRHVRRCQRPFVEIRGGGGQGAMGGGGGGGLFVCL